ncbi:MAG: PstS family phosphate ABC transporter substrate-binding protein [Cyanobacteriota bacterium SKYGB_h_bin112]|nr:PstS family phosphate ABC transporter substrate-binding protein [Cyanobacteriota bacterium SKYGB_h_bin112]
MVMFAKVVPLMLSLASLAAVFGLTACGNSPTDSSTNANASVPTKVLIDGSSTVYPISEEAAQEYTFERKSALEFDVKFSGTGGGFKKFCAGQTDISNASRPIKQDEMQACKANGIEFIELPIAYDALTVVVHPSNTWVDKITLAELKAMWEPAAEGKVTRWSQVRPGWPDRPLKLYGPGKDSGTFDYFTEAVVGKRGASRADYTDSEDDAVLARGVKRDPEALAYFGYAYYEENEKALKAVPIDSGKGPVIPSSKTVVDGTYTPLARPLFIYVNKKSLADKPDLKPFVEFYILNAENLAKRVGYTPLPDEAYVVVLEHLKQQKVGTVFDGKAKPGVTIEELMKKEAAF